MDRGLFITLEGPDGTGKSTQAALLAERLRGAGRRVKTVREPGSTPVGERIRDVLLDRAHAGMSMRAELLLYMAARAELVSAVIEPSLASGEDVVSDRFLLSSVVYQGVAGGLGADSVWTIGEFATAGLLPDLTVILDLGPEQAADRRGGDRDRLEDRGASYQARVRQGFLDWAQGPQMPAAVVVDGGAAVEQVAERIWDQVRPLLAEAASSKGRQA